MVEREKVNRKERKDLFYWTEIINISTLIVVNVMQKWLKEFLLALFLCHELKKLLYFLWLS